jgi:uncharacterized RDD family membrane protein YckC
MSEKFNPFEPPATDWVPTRAGALPRGAELAGRGARLMAAIVDSLLVLCVVGPAQYFFGVFDGFPSNMQELGYVKETIWALVGFATWLAMNGYLLATRGQSVGKLLLGIQIVNLDDDEPATFKKVLLLRELPFRLCAILPDPASFLVLIDPLAIFFKDRRCLHDYVAKTRVIVRPSPPGDVGPWLR